MLCLNWLQTLHAFRRRQQEQIESNMPNLQIIIIIEWHSLTMVAWNCNSQGWSCALFVFQVMGVVGPSSVADGLPLLHLSPYLSPPLPFSTAVVRLVALQIQVWLPYLFVTLIKLLVEAPDHGVLFLFSAKAGQNLWNRSVNISKLLQFGVSALSLALSCASVILLEISKIAESFSPTITSGTTSVI